MILVDFSEANGQKDQLFPLVSLRRVVIIVIAVGVSNSFVCIYKSYCHLFSFKPNNRTAVGCIDVFKAVVYTIWIEDEDGSHSSVKKDSQIGHCFGHLLHQPKNKKCILVRPSLVFEHDGSMA